MSAETGEIRSARAAEDGTTIVVRSGRPASSDDRAAQLTDRVFEVIEALNGAVGRSDASIVVDFRMEAAKGTSAWPNALAFLQAVRGLVQSLTLELVHPAPAVNVVVSSDAEAEDRDRTIGYLHSADGQFARGATYDLRSER